MTQKKSTTKQSTDRTEKFAYFKDYIHNDPAYAADCQKYGRAIPSRPFITSLIQQHSPLHFHEICQIFGLTQHWQKSALSARLSLLVSTGKIALSTEENYVPIDPNAVVKGSVIGHGEGYGYLVPDGGGESLFLSAQTMQSLLHGDYISARVVGTDHRGRAQAEFVELLARKTERLIGRLQKNARQQLVLIPENRRITQQFLIATENSLAAKVGQIVMVKMLTPPGLTTAPTAEVTAILGDQMNAGLEIKIALFNHQIPHEWSAAVMEEVSVLPDEVTEQDKQGRLDLRELPLVTIDGLTARDFDDAVYAAPASHGFTLYVAIADVSHYVQVGTQLNQAAQERATSVYFPDQVVPMLPEKLSNGLCSLNPDLDRLCMVAVMEIDAQGNLLSAAFHNAVMRSHARLTYETVAELLAGDVLLRRAYKTLVPHLECLYALFHVLKKHRDQRGSINFETRETLIEYDSEGNIERIKPSERNDAHMLIEECMVIANIAAAQLLRHYQIPTLYRVHPRPQEERLVKLRQFLAEFNLGLNGGNQPEPSDFAEILLKIQDNEAFDMIQLVILRSLSQAAYQPMPEGHFGLALEDYAHFTSPIRRYPDLLVHRGIKALISQGIHTIAPVPENIPFNYDLATMTQLGLHCSMAERRADDAVREVTDWLKCRFMQQYIGETFAGKITGVTNFGIFVELETIFIEGLIHISSLTDDYYRFDNEHHRLVGERTGKVLRLMDHVNVKVLSSQPETRKIDFGLLSITTRRSLGQKKTDQKMRGTKTSDKDHKKKKKRSDQKPTMKGSKTAKSAKKTIAKSTKKSIKKPDKSQKVVK